MNKKTMTNFFIFAVVMVFVLLQFSCAKEQANEKKGADKTDIVARGAYLVNLGGCNDCHSPKTFTDMGPMPDTTKLLSGHPADSKLPKFDPATVKPGNWYLASGDLTAWVGPWGISYTANLTPDEPTGIGTWTDDVFIKAMRTGKHMGVGRPILPPMPWMFIAKATDDDLKAIFAYLKSIPPIHNQVPDPVAPDKLTVQK